MSEHSRHHRPPGAGSPGAGPAAYAGGGAGGGGTGAPPQNRSRRGDVRGAILLLLTEGNANGFGLMQEIDRRSSGAWKPGADAVYPMVSQLEDEGLVASQAGPAGRILGLTERGRAAMARRPDGAPTPWEEVSRAIDDDVWALTDTARQINEAVTRLTSNATGQQVRTARFALEEARRQLASILSEGTEVRGRREGP